MDDINGDNDSREPSKPPEPSAPPILGHALPYARDPFGFVDQTVAEYGPVVSFSFPGQNGILLAEPDAIEHVLASNAENYCKGAFQRKELEGLLGDGLLISEGKQWEAARDVIQPAFYPGQIAEYASLMVDCTEQQLADWSNGDVVDVAAAMSGLTLTILGDVVFDADFREANTVRTAAKAITNRFRPDSTLPIHVPHWMPLPRNRRYRQAVNELDAFVADLIADRRRNSTGRDDLLSTLTESEMSDTEIRDHLVTFLLAGHETTALALTYTLFCLATHPNEQAAVTKEVTSLDGRPTRSDSLPRTDRAITEALRLYPPSHLVMREAVNDDIVANYRVPEGTLMICSQWATHRRDTFYQAPEVFDPDRWVTDDRPEYAYFPFGGGPRICIGRRFALMEARLVLATLLQSFNFEPITQDLDLAASMTLAPTHPVKMHLTT